MTGFVRKRCKSISLRFGPVRESECDQYRTLVTGPVDVVVT